MPTVQQICSAVGNNRLQTYLQPTLLPTVNCRKVDDASRFHDLHANTGIQDRGRQQRCRHTNTGLGAVWQICTKKEVTQLSHLLKYLLIKN